MKAPKMKWPRLHGPVRSVGGYSQSKVCVMQTRIIQPNRARETSDEKSNHGPGLLLILAGGLTACDKLGLGSDSDDVDAAATPPPVIANTETPAPDPVPVQPAASQTVTATIDWNAARDDKASRRSLGEEADEMAVTIQSADGQSAAVPVLLPTGIVSIASADGTGGPRYRPLEDGYFAAYPGAVYDIIVNGTNQVTNVDDKAYVRNDDLVFTATAAGAQVSLSRYGADYLIEFECNEIEADTGTCISEEDALAVAENLIRCRFNPMRRADEVGAWRKSASGS